MIFRAYQLLVSPILHLLTGAGFGCRFDPTCSQYFSEAVGRHGWSRGSLFGIKRILKCHPWGKYGYDPVPEKDKE